MSPGAGGYCHSSFVVLAVSASLSIYHHLTFVLVNFFFCAILKVGEVKVEYGQIITHDDKEDEALQLEGQGGRGGPNQLKTMVRARYF